MNRLHAFCLLAACVLCAVCAGCGYGSAPEDDPYTAVCVDGTITKSKIPSQFCVAHGGISYLIGK